MSPAMYPCSNPFCPHDGLTTRAGDMCDECKKRAGIVDRLLDRLETDEAVNRIVAGKTAAIAQVEGTAMTASIA